MPPPRPEWTDRDRADSDSERSGRASSARRRLIAVLSARRDRRRDLRHQPRRDRTRRWRCSIPGSTPPPPARSWPRSRPRACAFEVRDATILVDRAARDRVRMDLAAKGLPAGGPAGYEILDSLSGFGTTSQMFDAAYWRAKEGELARTITGSPNVRAARVHLANPVSQPFARTARRLGLGHRDHGARHARPRPGRGDPLPGLLGGGRHRAGGGGGDRFGPRRGARRHRTTGLTRRRARPRRPRRDAARQHPAPARGARRPGPRHRRGQRRRRHGQPDHHRAGHRPRQPGGDQLGDRGELGELAGRRRRASRWRATCPTATSRAAPRATRRSANAEPRAAELRGLRDPARAGDPARPGAPDQRRGHGRRAHADRPPTAPGAWAPRPREEIETLQQLVQSAIGFDAERGDTVTIESLQFTLPPEQGSLAERGGAGFLAAERRAAGADRRARRRSCSRSSSSCCGRWSAAGRGRAGRADRPARVRRRRGAPRRGAAACLRATSSTCRRRPSPRSTGCARSSPAAARTPPPCCAAGSNPPTPARSPPDHERLPPGDLLPGAGARARPRRAARAPARGVARGGLPGGLPRRARRPRPRPPRGPEPADQRARRGARRRAHDQRGGAPPRRRQPRADGRGARAQPSRRRWPRPAWPPRSARLVARALAAAPEARPRLRCAPELAAAARRSSPSAASPATVEAAPELLPREAQVFWDQGYDHLDLDACIAQIRACLALAPRTAQRGRATMTHSRFG